MRKIDRTHIKLAIAEATSTTRHNRVEASRNFSAAGKLLAECFATGTNPSNEYYTLHGVGLKHKSLADYRWHRRHLTLAAAFLNNTSYRRCEVNSDKEADGSLIVKALDGCIEGDVSPEIIVQWLMTPTLTRHDLMPDTASRSWAADETRYEAAA